LAKRKERPIQPPARRIVAVSPDDGAAIDLKQPELAAVLAWLIPGLGHLYQGRTRKGAISMGVVTIILLLGLWLGSGRVVYASRRPNDTRWWFVPQAGIGMVAIPAVMQSLAVNGPSREPIWLSGWLAPPLYDGQLVSRRYADRLVQTDPYLAEDDFFDRPPYRQFRADQISMWHHELGRFFELGTLYTVVAGMLNLLLIYDAWAGPMHPPKDKHQKKTDEPTDEPANGEPQGAPESESDQPA
jgi:hypothetical protein